MRERDRERERVCERERENERERERQRKRERQREREKESYPPNIKIFGNLKNIMKCKVYTFMPNYKQEKLNYEQKNLALGY